MESAFLVIVEHDKPIPDLCDLVAARAWTIDGVAVQGKRPAVTARVLDPMMLEAIGQVEAQLREHGHVPLQVHVHEAAPRKSWLRRWLGDYCFDR